MSIGFILFLYNLFLCDIDSIYTMFFLILLVILYGPRVCNKRLNKQRSNCSLVYLDLYMLEARRHMLHEKILKKGCSLVRFGVYILIRLYFEKLMYFYIINN